MSSFLQNTKNPKTGKFEPAVWLDDYYGHHNYGVKFLDGEFYDPRKVTLDTTSTLVNAVWDDFFPQPKQQEQGNDLATSEPLANTEPDESAQTTIEDKLSKITNCELDKDGDLIDWMYESGRLKLSKTEIDGIQAIITTETTKARIEAIASYKKVLKLEETALAETDRYDLLSNKQRKQLVDYHTNCLAALQKEQKR